MVPKGIITAMVTPFDEKGKIDREATEKLVDRLIAKNIHGLFILGTNGEFHVLSKEEKIYFAEIVIKAAAKRVPVYVGTGGNSTEEVIELTKVMENLGADAVSVITPYFVVPTEEELYHHYKKIAEEVNIPIIMYNIPRNTGIHLSTGLVARLAKMENIIGIKDSSGKLEAMKDYIEATRDENFSVLAGSDSQILKALEIGATGAVAATSNVLTKIEVSIYENWLANNKEAAEKAQNSIQEFRRIYHMATIPSVLKEAMALTGMPVGKARLPVLGPTEEDMLEIKKVMRAYVETYGEL